MEKIKVCYINRPKKIISFLKNIESEEVTLDKIRPKIIIMQENYLFTDKFGDEIDQSIEGKTTLGDILDKDQKNNLKIYIVEPSSSDIENNHHYQGNQKNSQKDFQKLEKENIISNSNEADTKKRIIF